MSRGKYLMRVKTANGSYRYLYTPEEVAAYKQGGKEQNQMTQKKKTYSVSGIASSPHYEYKETKDYVEKYNSKDDGFKGSMKVEKYGRGDGSRKIVTTTDAKINKKDKKELNKTPEEKAAYNTAKKVFNSGKTLSETGNKMVYDGKHSKFKKEPTTTYTKGKVTTNKKGDDKMSLKETEVTGSYRKDEKKKRSGAASAERMIAKAYSDLQKKAKKKK